MTQVPQSSQHTTTPLSSQAVPSASEPLRSLLAQALREAHISSIMTLPGSGHSVWEGTADRLAADAALLDAICEYRARQLNTAVAVAATQSVPLVEWRTSRGLCPVCDRWMRLKADGTLRHHGGPKGSGPGWSVANRVYHCDGADKSPLAIREDTPDA